MRKDAGPLLNSEQQIVGRGMEDKVFGEIKGWLADPRHRELMSVLKILRNLSVGQGVTDDFLASEYQRITGVEPTGWGVWASLANLTDLHGDGDGVLCSLDVKGSPFMLFVTESGKRVIERVFTE